MKIESARISKEESSAIREIADTAYFKSNFKFLRQHNGWRKKALHIFIGEESGGKSTLTRTLIIDTLEGSKHYGTLPNVGLWLSEESVQDFKTEYALCGYGDLSDRIKILSEQDNETFRTARDYLKSMEQMIEEYNLKILFIDNITTSERYVESNPAEQAIIANTLKRIAKVRNIPIVIIAHTGAGVTNGNVKLIENNHIVGSKAFPRIANFFYILQPIRTPTNRYNIIRTTKHRGYQLTSGLHELYYSSKVRLFIKDAPLFFNDFKEMFKEREQL